MRSIIVEVRQAVVDGIRTLLEEKVSVTYGWQGGDEARYREQVFTNGGRGSHGPAALKPGRNFRNEELSFDIIVLVLGVGMKPEEADTRALEIGEQVEEFVADHKSNELGITGLNWLVMDEFALSPNRITANGSVSEVTYSVRYSARLT